MTSTLYNSKAYQKCTRFIGTLPGLDTVGSRCSRDHEHEVVEDGVHYDGRFWKRSELAGIYPAGLCAELATCVIKAQVLPAPPARGSRPLPPAL